MLLALVGGAGWIVIQGATEAPAVVAAFITGIGALLGLLLQPFMQQHQAAELRRRDQMRTIYEQLLTFFYSTALGRDPKSEEQEEFFENLAKALMLYGSPKILRAFLVWRRAATEREALDDESERDQAAAAFVLLFGELLLAMRADLGISNDDLDAVAVLGVVINDLDDYLSSSAPDVHDAATP